MPRKKAVETQQDQQVEITQPEVQPVEPTTPVEPVDPGPYVPPIYTQPRDKKSKGQIALYAAGIIILLAIIVAIL